MSQSCSSVAPDGLIALLLAFSDGADPRVAALLAAHPLGILARFDTAALQAAGGLSSRQAARLAAAFALGREVERASQPRRARLDRPAAVARLLAPEVRGLEVETFHTLVLDARHELVAHERVAMGTLMTAPDTSSLFSGLA
jgi:DNA repair protein RadC